MLRFNMLQGLTKFNLLEVLFLVLIITFENLMNSFHQYPKIISQCRIFLKEIRYRPIFIGDSYFFAILEKLMTNSQTKQS